MAGRIEEGGGTAKGGQSVDRAGWRAWEQSAHWACGVKGGSQVQTREDTRHRCAKECPPAPPPYQHTSTHQQWGPACALQRAWPPCPLRWAPSSGSGFSGNGGGSTQLASVPGRFARRRRAGNSFGPHVGVGVGSACCGRKKWCVCSRSTQLQRVAFMAPTTSLSPLALGCWVL